MGVTPGVEQRKALHGAEDALDGRQVGFAPVDAETAQEIRDEQPETPTLKLEDSSYSAHGCSVKIGASLH